MTLLVALLDFAVLTALAMCLSRLSDHHGMPDGLIYRGGLLRLGDHRNAS